MESVISASLSTLTSKGKPSMPKPNFRSVVATVMDLKRFNLTSNPSCPVVLATNWTSATVTTLSPLKSAKILILVPGPIALKIPCLIVGPKSARLAVFTAFSSFALTSAMVSITSGISLNALSMMGILLAALSIVMRAVSTLPKTELISWATKSNSMVGARRFSKDSILGRKNVCSALKMGFRTGEEID